VFQVVPAGRMLSGHADDIQCISLQVHPIECEGPC
jgi:hypothetical protein